MRVSYVLYCNDVFQRFRCRGSHSLLQVHPFKLMLVELRLKACSLGSVFQNLSVIVGLPVRVVASWLAVLQR
jgi:hypothetical protein